MEMTLLENLLSEIVNRLAEELEIIKSSAKAARDEATHAETKQEGKYDTRAIEAGYLAGAQAERAKVLESQMSVIKRLDPARLPKDGKVRPYSIVKVEQYIDGKAASLDDCLKNYLLLPSFGGIEVFHKRRAYMSITTSSPLGSLLLGAQQGDVLELNKGDLTTEITVVAVI